MLRCRALLPLPEVFVPLQTSPLKRSKRIINAANLKRCKSESRIASRSVCAFPVSAAARKSVPVCRSHERGRNLEGEVIKLGGAISERKAKSFAIHFGSWLARPPNIQGIRRVWGKNLTLPRKLGTPRLLSAVIREVSFLLSFRSTVCIIPSTYPFYDLFLSRSFVRCIVSIENSRLRRGREGGFLLRVPLDKYFLLFSRSVINDIRYGLA